MCHVMDWDKLGNSVSDMITKLIAATILVLVLTLLVTLDEESVALIAVLAGIAGSAATFLFAPKSGR